MVKNKSDNKTKFHMIEEDFYELDKEMNLAFIKLEFDKASDIFDSNAITKTPILNDEFLERIKKTFDLAPNKYKINLDIYFNDFEGYTEDGLLDIFFKNVVLESKLMMKQNSLRTKIALSLLGVGIILLVGMILILGLWTDQSILKEIVSYIMDIAACVTFWEVFTILIIESKERRSVSKNLINKFGKISFHQK